MSLTKTADVLVELQREWDLNYRDQPNPWTTDELRNCPTLGDVVAVLHRSTSDEANAIGWALMCQYWAGDADAGRLLLQAMLPRVAKVSKTARDRGLADPVEATLEGLWALIAHYPRHRRKVITTLALDVLQTMGGDDFCIHTYRSQRRHGFHVIDVAEDVLAHLAEHSDIEPVRDGRSLVEQAAAQATELLTWAQENNVLTPGQMMVLSRTYLRTEHVPHAQIANELGISADAVRYHHSTGVRALASAARKRLQAAA